MDTSRTIATRSSEVAKYGPAAARLLSQLRYWLSRPGAGVQADGKHWVYNSLPALAEQTGLTVKQVRKAVCHLKAAGAIEVVRINGIKQLCYSLPGEAEGRLGQGVATAEPLGAGRAAAKGTLTNSNEPKMSSKMNQGPAGPQPSAAACPVHEWPDGVPPNGMWIDSTGTLWDGTERVPIRSREENKAQVRRLIEAGAFYLHDIRWLSRKSPREVAALSKKVKQIIADFRQESAQPGLPLDSTAGQASAGEREAKLARLKQILGREAEASAA